MLPFDKTLIVLPTYNEAKNIKKMLEALSDMSRDLSMLVIDDGSPDGTAKIVKEFQKSNNKVHLIERAGKQGLGTAYILGFNWGLDQGFDYIFSMDSDFSHELDGVPRMLEAALQADLVIGSRYVGGIRIFNWPFKRLLISYLGSMYVRTVTGMPITDPTAGYNCYTRKALKALDFSRIISIGYSFQVEMKYRIWCKNLRIVESPIIFYERKEGVSKMSGKIVREALINVLVLKVRNLLGKL